MPAAATGCAAVRSGRRQGGRSSACLRPRHRLAPVPRADRFQPQRGDRGEQDDEEKQHQDRFPGQVRRRAADRLVDPRHQIPCAGDDLAVVIGEGIHADSREADAHEAEGRRGEQRADADGARHRTQEQCQKRADELVRQDEQDARQNQQPAIAAQWHVENTEENGIGNRQDDEEDQRIGQDLACHGGPQAAAEPPQDAQTMARLDVEAERIGHGRDDHDLQNARQQGREKEMRIIEGRVEKRVHLHRNGCDGCLRGVDRLAPCGAQRQTDPGSDGRNGGADAAQCQIACRHCLDVIEEYHLRPPAGQDVAFEITRQHQQAVNRAGEDEPAALGEVADVEGDRGIGRRIDHADDLTRQIGAILIKHGDRQAGRQPGAEDRGQKAHQQQRQGCRQEQQDRPAAKPVELPPENEKETWAHAPRRHLNAPTRRR
ncbi:hypothetical protein RHECNPAF_12600127 [Rhizobium etli CNPAF512]|nr:hypothetical protein RHECNPAF_12600127 [Rhizobium etli CNPAF512]